MKAAALPMVLIDAVILVIGVVVLLSGNVLVGTGLIGFALLSVPFTLVMMRQGERSPEEDVDALVEQRLAEERAKDEQASSGTDPLLD